MWKVINDSSGYDVEIITHLTTVFWYAAPAVSILLLVGKSQLNKNYFWYFCAVAIALSLISITFITGVRGRLLWVVSLFFLASFYFNRKKYILITIPLLVIMVPLFSVLGSGEIRHNILAGSSLLQNVASVYEKVTSNSLEISSSIDNKLNAYISRAQGVRNSATLYQDYDAGGGGFGVYLGVLTALVPAKLLENKPILGSNSPDVNGFAMYKVIRLGYDRGGELGPLLASAHAYWVGGWVWLISNTKLNLFEQEQLGFYLFKTIFKRSIFKTFRYLNFVSLDIKVVSFFRSIKSFNIC